MTWLRTNLPLVLLALAVLVVGGALVNRAKWVALADAAEVRADSLAAVTDSIGTANAALAAEIRAADSVYSAQTLVWAAERAQSAIAAERAQERAQTLSVSLRASLDSAQSAMFADYEAEIEAERAASERIRATMAEEIEALGNRLEDRDALIASLYAEIDVRTAETLELRAANEALRNAVAPSFLTRIFDSWETHAVVAGLGVVGGLVIR